MAIMLVRMENMVCTAAKSIMHVMKAIRFLNVAIASARMDMGIIGIVRSAEYGCAQIMRAMSGITRMV